MQLRYIALSVVSLLVLLAIAVLLVKVTESPVLEVSERDLAEARQRYHRSIASPTGNQRAIAPVAPTRSRTPGSSQGNSARPAGASSATHSTPGRPANNESNATRTMSDTSRSARGRDLVRTGPGDRPPVAPSTGTAVRQGTLEARMNEGNRRYDAGDYEAAVEQARSVLEDYPDNVRMLRVMVSSGCLMGDDDLARQYYPKLPERDQRVMRIRCARYGIEF